jgi:hypothetical protein
VQLPQSAQGSSPIRILSGIMFQYIGTHHNAFHSSRYGLTISGSIPWYEYSPWPNRKGDHEKHAVMIQYSNFIKPSSCDVGLINRRTMPRISSLFCLKWLSHTCIHGYIYTL